MNTSEKYDHDVSTPSMAKLRWQCRRGMLELDLLLLPFLETQYQTLSIEEQKAFVELLNLPDQTLYSLFTLSGTDNHLPNNNKELLKMVQKIRFHSLKK